jgi:hypothetical protein
MRFKYTLPTAAAALTLLFSSPVLAAPVLVRCGPGQHAVVHNGFAHGKRITSVACVSGSGYRQSDRTRYTAHRIERRHRSWGKSALIIGGSAGTGAGIGGIVHGRKGALIGAGIGGGAASIYEGVRRR